MRAWLEARPYATVGLVGLMCLLAIVVGTSSCGGVPGASNGNDGRKTKYDNVRVQKIALTADEGGGTVVCITDYHSGIAISCNWPAR